MSDLDPNQAGSNYEQEQMHKEGTDYIKDQAQQNQYGDDGTGRQGDTFDKPVSDGPPTDTISGSGAGDTFDEPVNRNNPDSEDYSNTQSSTNDETSGTTEGGAPPKSSGRMENESAIPTAGGQRLGEEHWGESKVVPENPKPQDTEGGGSFDSETADNTAKNTGGAHGGSEGEGKQSMMDKIKDKLPIGNKNKD